MNFFFFKLFTQKLFTTNFNKNFQNIFIKENVKMMMGLSFSLLTLKCAFSNNCINYNKSYLKDKELATKYKEHIFNNE